MITVLIDPAVRHQAEARYVLEVCRQCLGLIYGDQGPVRLHYGAQPPQDDPHAVWIPYRPQDWIATAFEAAEAPLKEAGWVALRHDLVAIAFAALTLQAERPEAVDSHRRKPAVNTEVLDGLAWVPPVLSEHLETLRQALAIACERAGIPLVRLAPWPEGRPFAVMVSHDVDRIFEREAFKLGAGMIALVRSLRAGRLARVVEETQDLLRSLLWPTPAGADFEALMALEADHGVRSTFFFLGGRRWARYGSRYRFRQRQVRSISRRLLAQGHEVGSHGSYYAFNLADDYRAERQALGTHLGVEAHGIRNHYLRFAYPDTWTAQEAAGYDFDATLGFHDAPGFRSRLAFPYHPYDPDRQGAFRLLSLPLGVMDGTLFEYQGLDEADAWRATERVLAATAKHGGFTSLLWHNNYFGTPRYAHWERVYARALAWIVSRGAWAVPGKAITAWWRDRAAVSCNLERDHEGWVAEISHPTGLYGLTLLLERGDDRLQIPIGRLEASVARRLPLEMSAVERI